jgi:hypothetical protein
MRQRYEIPNVHERLPADALALRGGRLGIQ